MFILISLSNLEASIVRSSIIHNCNQCLCVIYRILIQTETLAISQFSELEYVIADFSPAKNNSQFI